MYEKWPLTNDFHIFTLKIMSMNNLKSLFMDHYYHMLACVHELSVLISRLITEYMVLTKISFWNLQKQQISSKPVSNIPDALKSCIELCWFIFSLLGQGCFWEGGWGYWDCLDCLGWESKLLQHWQVKLEQEREKHCLQSDHTTDVEKGIHPGIFPWQKIHECLLCPKQADKDA